ncbi:TlpA family protein disulfide reductase [Chitinophaga nivalis]|uniref:TlpA family protein disulfide reductase n=1 Tax=Chitinophaga nivalis TaxID=2991709 RepID=A0ABT3IPK2_9BACT|nr:TlpA family protein disulfide reductase [Chitinophaga nivalis]MCW3464413.1 TlpA family protein disulfide reductase [Chitinophaga nivalis]MCW3485896.1 TlpA family protein disulfide reductase [Chitinophaga nivalis]
MHCQKPIIICNLLLAALTVSGQQVTIEGVWKHTADPVIVAALPVDGKQFEGAANRILIDTLTGTFRQHFPLSQPGFITVTNAWNSRQFFASPGKVYTITGDSSLVMLKGDQQEGQELLQDLKLAEDTREDATLLNGIATAEGRVSKVKDMIRQKQKAVAQLHDSGKINDAFFKALHAAIQRYYIDLLSTNFYFEYRSKEDNVAGVKAFRTEYLPVWKKLYEDQAIFNNLLPATGYLSVLGRYSAYREIADSGRLIFTQKKGNYRMDDIDYFRKVLKGPALEYAWADFIVSGINMNLYESAWKNYYNQFRKTFPQSKLTPLLSGYIDKITAYEKAASNPNNGAEFLAGYDKMKQLKEVFAALKGKVSYIDLWATWCVPCRAELQYSLELHDTLHQLGVQSLYLSLDNEAADAKWKEMVKHLPLKGLNMRTSNELHQDINDNLPRYTGIPRYIILDKNGDVVVWDAKRPSDKLELITQLKQYL